MSDVMSQPVVHCHPFDGLREAAGRLVDGELGCLPVLASDGSRRLVGMLTPGDVVYGALRDGGSFAQIQVRSVMAPPGPTCRPGDSLASAADRMRSQHVRRLAVVDEGRRLIGLLSSADLARAFTQETDGEPAARALCQVAERAGRPGGPLPGPRARDSACFEAA